MSSSKNWSKEAHSYLIDPLNAPEPSEETGPGTHFRSTFAPHPSAERTPTVSSKKDHPPTPPSATSQLSSNNPFRRVSVGSKDPTNKHASSHVRQVSDGLPTPPTSASPRQSRYRAEAFAAYADEDAPQQRRSSSAPRASKQGTTRSRANSLGERYPGDRSHQPLDQLMREQRRARRAPHLQKRHMPGADTIDKLDSGAVRPYHHEGPYDAALLARNTSFASSPVAAVAETNAEALKATPKENIMDSLERHRPLDGVATIPPGGTDRFGRKYEYEEGGNQMIENGGNYKRWPGVEYHPDDIKGKGEPSYSIEKALKEHKIHGDSTPPRSRAGSKTTADATGIEMTDRMPHNSRNHEHRMSGEDAWNDYDGQPRRSNSKRLSGGLKSAFGSLRRRKESAAQ
ncbi:hypothetical protein K402DRAFT_443494 [Aulographum hederae CBS 113979]|uniref:Pal1-domain-containing protein n=1 Tax=Aulographum hederae CBS 113979 TaxID=1176131 RepID=A0A6G1HGC2_9PEZI|nr:hypothetical protein K402DRAFT_443494 [Aulographum hederae CBS 113979]